MFLLSIVSSTHSRTDIKYFTHVFRCSLVFQSVGYSFCLFDEISDLLPQLRRFFYLADHMWNELLSIRGVASVHFTLMRRSYFARVVQIFKNVLSLAFVMVSSFWSELNWIFPELHWFLKRLHMFQILFIILFIFLSVRWQEKIKESHWTMLDSFCVIH